METIYERLDLNKTRAKARRHLKTLGQNAMRQEIMEYLHYTSSIISGLENNNNNRNKVLDAMEKMSKNQKEIADYLKSIVNCINRLEKNQRDALLGKYLYAWDVEEQVRYLNKSISSIRNLIRDAEVDFAILMDCIVMKGDQKDE